MCFVKSKHCMTHVVSDEDQFVYKVMYRYHLASLEWFGSIHYNRYMPYHLTETIVPANTIDLEQLDEKKLLTNGVIHCINGGIMAKTLYDEYVNSRYSAFGELVIVQCIIPKGTPFWVNKNFVEIACTKLVLWRIVEREELSHGLKNEAFRQAVCERRASGEKEEA